MTYLPPWVVFGTHRLDPADIDAAAGDYETLIRGLHDDTLDLDRWLEADTLNDATGEAA